MHLPPLKKLITSGLLLLVAAAVPVLLWVQPVRRIAGGALLPFLRAKEAVQERIEALVDKAMPLDESERAQWRRTERLVAQLQIQVRTAKNALEENRELRLYYELAPASGWRLVVAPIIARDPITWNRTFRIGKGSRQGVLVGAAVMAGNQVLGRVAEVTPNSAVVTTLADPACRLSVRLPASNAVGIIGGRVDQDWHAAPRCRITALPRDDDYAADEYVVTSGLGGTVPAGLPIGRVTAWEDGSVKRIVDTAYAELLVVPTAEYSVFHFIAVVVPRVSVPAVK